MRAGRTSKAHTFETGNTHECVAAYATTTSSSSSFMAWRTLPPSAHTFERVPKGDVKKTSKEKKTEVSQAAQG